MCDAMAYQKGDKSKIIHVADIMRVLSNNSSLLLFDNVATASGTSDLLMRKLNLTPKQFYSRMSCLVECGLIKRKSRKLFLTSFGKIVYSVMMTFKEASESYYKLKMIDLMKTSNDRILKDELDKIIDLLLRGNPQIKQTVVT